MRGKRARRERQARRERLEAIARGEVQLTRREQVDALKRKRDARLVEVSKEFNAELQALQELRAANHKAVWADYRRAVEALDVVDAAAIAEASGIVVAPAATDLDAVADKLTEVTGRPAR